MSHKHTPTKLVVDIQLLGAHLGAIGQVARKMYGCTQDPAMQAEITNINRCLLQAWKLIAEAEQAAGIQTDILG